MLPLKDDVPSSSVALVTVLLVVANIAVFLYQLSLDLGPSGPAQGAGTGFVMEFGAIPCRLTGACVEGDLPSPFLTVITSMFLHGGLLHVGGNMLYLWIFGDNVEDTLGHFRFAVFYLLSGIGAAAAQTITNPSSTVPMVGASGAISGVLAAYLVLFPRASILTLITFGFFIKFVHVPAVIVLGFWIVVQLANGALSYGMGGGEGGGVAWFAHVGGFVTGLILIFVLRPRRTARI